ncbi:hypothetical protein GE061_009400 [Apolygus lucorum]|uniref:Carboxypeptidase n=1 Tax=Apolygus lucorum TaxID=248454 RepID=A0A8S9Y0E2_APOLU|nr:hypothetical protein GE061_009400 [Apolygus lucorum]
MAIKLFNLLVASCLLCSVYFSSTVTGDSESRRPAFVTPYIEEGKISLAQRKANAESLMPGSDNVKSYAGFFTVDKRTDSNMFFWYFPPLIANARSAEVPVILWLQGGPGVSSMFGAFMLNGPYRLDSEGLTRHNYTWAKYAHLLYLDNPVGVGFSFTGSKKGYCIEETKVGHNLYTALVQFFKLFPKLQNNPLIIAGESYAGKYLPALGITIHNKNPDADVKLNLQGIAIGNGWIDPINMMDFGDIMYYTGLLDMKGRKVFNAERDKVLQLMRSGNRKEAFSTYDKWILGDFTPYPTLYKNLTGLDTYYNFMQMGKTPRHYELLEDFFNEKKNKYKLNAGERNFKGYSKEVALYLRYDILKSRNDWMATLMDNYRVLLYNGQLDIKCAYALTNKFLSKLEWSGAEDFRESDRQHYYVDGELAGYVKTVDKFSHMLIRNSGHMVPRDQPKWAERMIYAFAYNIPFDEPVRF